jgi:tetratricopeptide (TPR) repeat protein
MKYIAALLQILVFSFAANAFSPISSRSSVTVHRALVNVIEGTVYDPNHRPVPDLWIELQNEFNLNLSRVRSGGNGRFTFTGMGSGRYYIKVYTTGTNFEEQTQSVEIVNVVQNASDTVYQDIVLRYQKGMGNIGIANAIEAVFVQEIPPEAKRLYNSGVKNLGGKDVQKGQDELDQAIKIFPDYYDALNALGCNYVALKEYQKSFPYLIHAIDINRRSFSSFYSLAYAAYKVNKLPEASEAARASVILQPNSINGQLLYGTILRITGDTDKALETLLKADKLSKDAPVAEVHWQLALLYNKLNRNKEAADELEKYLRIDPDVANKKQVQELIAKLRSKST